MAEVIYKGDHAGVLVPITASVSVTCVWGEPCEVPDEVAASLLTSSAWMKSGKASATATLMDADGTVGRAYGARTTPHMYIVNPAGTLVYAGAIDSKPSANPADIPGATNHVKQALAESLAGKPVSVASTRPYGCSVKYPSPA